MGSFCFPLIFIKVRAMMIVVRNIIVIVRFVSGIVELGVDWLLG